MMLTRKQAYVIAGVLLLILVLLLINLAIPYPLRDPGPLPPARLRIVSARLLQTEDGKRRLEFTTDQPITADASYKIIFGTKTGYRLDGTGFLTTRDKAAGPTFLINVMELARFDEPEKKKMLDEHIKAGNIHWVDIAIYHRGEFLHDPDIFTDERKLAQARFDDP